jgi:hypothetical protein
MIWKRYYTIILIAFMIVAIIVGCGDEAEKETGLTNEDQTAELDEYIEEDAESYDVVESGDQHKYSVNPGEYVLPFSVRLPYSEGYDDVQFRVQQSSLDDIGINVEVESVELEPYSHPIWVVDAEEGFMGLQKELFTKINDLWVVSLSDAEDAGRLSETEILRRLANKKYHYMNNETKTMETSSEELTVYQTDSESYIALVDVRMEIPADVINVHRQEAYIEGTPAGGFQITVTQPNKSGPIFIEGPNIKNPNE